ncbi:MAG TPA: response regulator transcription factor [Anaerolineae bacterium]|nr:response regulator transcription factor [Anaerolineae bacterium]
MNVFIVENSNFLRERLMRLLSQQRAIEVIGSAATPVQAVQEIRRLKPDVVLLDIRLDGGNGLQVLQQIKKDQKPPVVVVLTNYPYPQYRARYLANGADYFFDKSTELNSMLDVLQQLRYQVAHYELSPSYRTMAQANPQPRY